MNPAQEKSCITKGEGRLGFGLWALGTDDSRLPISDYAASASGIRSGPEFRGLQHLQDISKTFRPDTQFRRNIRELAVSLGAVGLQRSLPGKLAEGIQLRDLVLQPPRIRIVIGTA